MKFIRSVALIFALSPLALLAAPVYLDCIVTSGKEQNMWNVALDESTGTVSYSLPSVKFTGKYPGIFTADAVRFNGMEISRVDLSITIPIPQLSRTDKGRCEIVKEPQRKF